MKSTMDMAETVAAKPATLSEPPKSQATETKRLVSLDALRGFDMFWILGADALVVALNKLGHQCAPTRFLAMELSHCEWQGMHFYDLIFPLFVFIMGVSTVFSLTRIIQTEGRGAAVNRIFRRSILLFVLALIYSGGFSNPWPDLRLMGVLNRIAICYFFGGLMFCFLPPRVLVGVAVALLLGYWALFKYVPIRDIQMQPDALAALAQQQGNPRLAAQFRNIDDYENNPSATNGPVMAAARKMYFSTTNMVTGKYEMGYNVCNDFDFEHLRGRLYNSFWDPEGILSTIPAIVTGLFGIFAGLFLMNKSVPDERKVVWLIAMGVAAVVFGFFWGIHFPVIKKIWTSSYVLVAGGYSAILLGAFYWIVDVKKWQLWCRPFVWVGMNPITLYMVSNLTGGEGYRKMAARLAGGPVLEYLNTHVAMGFGNVVVSLVSIGLFFWLAGFMYRRKIFIRL